MFETAQVGQRVSKSEFKEREGELRTRLLDLQRQLRDSAFPVIVLLSGVEGAGKGEVVNRLSEWLDVRGVTTTGFWNESDEERERPEYWRFWRALPPRGTIGMLFGSWYRRPIIAHATGTLDAARFGVELNRIRTFESTLARDGALFVKLWFHIDRKTQTKRLQADVKAGVKSTTTALVKRFAKHYDAFLRTSEIAIRTTDTGEARWEIIEATDGRYRDLAAGTYLADALEARLAEFRAAPAPTAATAAPAMRTAPRTVLDTVDLESSLSADAYTKQLKRAQRQLGNLAWRARKQGRNMVAVFEGWDAAGKGGAIRRVIRAIDARLYRVISVAAPSDEERAQHYLWRFWRHLPRAGYVTVYDRSWYGRVLVERVEGFARVDEWQRAYQEINEFEQQLLEHGTILAKFWLHISADEQLRRFEERETIPWKRHKITQEDWRNRERWNDYLAAVHDMVTHTSTCAAPWHLIAGNDKRFARVQVIKTLCRRLQHSLD